MEIVTFAEVENYLKNKQVYFKKEIVDSSFIQTVAQGGKVHNIGNVEVKRINDNVIALTMFIDGIETTIYDYKTDSEFIKFIKTQFVPVSYLVQNWDLTKNKKTR